MNLTKFKIFEVGFEVNQFFKKKKFYFDITSYISEYEEASSINLIL